MPKLAVAKENDSPLIPNLLGQLFFSALETFGLSKDFCVWATTSLYEFPNAMSLAIPSTARCLARSLEKLSCLRSTEISSTTLVLSVAYVTAAYVCKRQTNPVVLKRQKYRLLQLARTQRSVPSDWFLTWH